MGWVGGARWQVFGLAENIATQPSLADAWAELGNSKLTVLSLNQSFENEFLDSNLEVFARANYLHIFPTKTEEMQK